MSHWGRVSKKKIKSIDNGNINWSSNPQANHKLLKVFAKLKKLKYNRLSPPGPMYESIHSFINCHLNLLRDVIYNDDILARSSFEEWKKDFELSDPTNNIFTLFFLSNSDSEPIFFLDIWSNGKSKNQLTLKFLSFLFEVRPLDIKLYSFVLGVSESSLFFIFTFSVVFCREEK